MRKRYSVIFILLAFIITMGCFSGFTKAFAETNKLQSKSAYLMDSMTKTVIYKQNEEERLPIASMCKIMT
ncbi:MAG: D-alanyl-D-alanine carboxypeptidase, partial [Clostridia bacterium]|nr:D-alanyl-D-alanine carboxypeptidase [Clostridia bacterium]